MSRHTMLRSAASVAGTVLLAVTAAGCGGGDEEGRFDDEVSEVRAAVEAGDRERALEALDVLALDALAAHEEGELEEAELQEVAELIDAAEQNVAELTTEATTTTTTTSSSTTTEPPVTEEPDDDDEDDGERKGKGKDKDD